MFRIVKSDITVQFSSGKDRDHDQGMDPLSVKNGMLLRRMLPLCLPVHGDNGFSAVQPGRPVWHVTHAHRLHGINGRRHTDGTPLLNHLEYLMLLRCPGKEIRPLRHGIPSERCQKPRQFPVQLLLTGHRIKGRYAFQDLVDCPERGLQLFIPPHLRCLPKCFLQLFLLFLQLFFVTLFPVFLGQIHDIADRQDLARLLVPVHDDVLLRQHGLRPDRAGPVTVDHMGRPVLKGLQQLLTRQERKISRSLLRLYVLTPSLDCLGKAGIFRKSHLFVQTVLFPVDDLIHGSGNPVLCEIDIIIRSGAGCKGMLQDIDFIF